MSYARNPHSILITGASSGIGAALAVAYAAPGVTLALSGRNQARLDDISTQCRESGAEVFARVINVTDIAGMKSWIDEMDAQSPLDLVIANAGISSGSARDSEEEAQTRSIFSVNLEGVLNTIWPAIDAMRPRKTGQLAIVASIAGFRGLPGAPAYSASKAAVLNYGDALRGMLLVDGIHVSVICPGYVVSRMTDTNTFPMPFLMSADKAAGIIKRRLAKAKGRIVFPWPMLWLMRVLQALPIALTDPFLSRLPKKN
jgi:short-subunit dehydrogenase